jgi:hypothetical protein
MKVVVVMVVDWRLPQDTTRILRWESGASTRVIRAKRNINPEFYPNSTHAEDRVRLRWAATISGPYWQERRQPHMYQAKMSVQAWLRKCRGGWQTKETPTLLLV